MRRYIGSVQLSKTSNNGSVANSQQDASLLSRLVLCPLAAILILAMPMVAFAENGPFVPVGHQGAIGDNQGSQAQIAGVQYNAKSKAIQIIADRNFSMAAARNYTLLKLPSPFRLVMDIPDSSLAITQGRKTQTIDVNRDGIKTIELSETEGRFYKAVRVVIYVDSAKTLWKLNANVQDNILALGSSMPLAIQKSGKELTTLAGNPPTKAAPAPVSSSPTPMAPVAPAMPAVSSNNQTVLQTVGREVIEEVSFKGDRLEVKASKGSTVKVKNRFTLNAPSRLVIDLENAVVASKDMLKSLYPPSNESDIRQVRIGQFDDNTVRLVIETSEPERVQSVYPGSDKRLLTVGMVSDASVAELPSDTVLGQITNVVVGKREGDTVVRIAADSQIVHRLTRKGDRIILELLNLASRPSSIDFDKDAFGEFDKIKTDTLTSGQPNSKLVVDLKQGNLDVDVQLAADNKTLDLVFIPPATRLTLNGSNSGPAARAPFAAKIVIDAGHGGKDLGANRDGVYEKDLNLQVLLLLKRELEKRGLTVYTTRSTDVFLPLPQITSVANSYHPDLFVSVHQNASTNAALNGIETYYYTPQSLALAQKVHKHMINNVSAPDRGVRKAMFYVIHHTAVPSILCEVGYISNYNERQELQSRDRQQKTAAAIADGVVEYLRSKVSAQAQQ